VKDIPPKIILSARNGKLPLQKELKYCEGGML
jgi:hypothetical protein